MGTSARVGTAANVGTAAGVDISQRSLYTWKRHGRLKSDSLGAEAIYRWLP